MSRPITAIINLSALSANLSLVRKYVKKTRIWSVVKANGYGHGIYSVYHGLKETDGFAVLDINEAIMLRENGWTGPILLLEGFFCVSDLKEIDHYKFTTTIHSSWQVSAIAKKNFHNPLNVYIKLNSGMNRLGFNNKNLLNVLEQLNRLKQVNNITLMTHFAYSDNYDGIKSQMKIVDNINTKLINSFCLANSSAILLYPETYKQWVRPGIILYGASPVGDWKDISNRGFQPVMTLQSELIAIQYVPSGEKIGYGGTYKLNKSKRIGIVACGYADGYPRLAPTGTPVLVEGTKTHTLGTVSMDMLVIDLEPCPSARIGSKVELWGNNIKIDKISMLSGTLSYELMTAISQRVKIQLK